MISVSGTKNIQHFIEGQLPRKTASEMVISIEDIYGRVFSQATPAGEGKEAG